MNRSQKSRLQVTTSISGNVRTLSLDIEEPTANGYEIISRKQGKEKIYFVADHEFSIPEIKIIIDALQAAGFVTEKKTAELVEKIAMIGGSHKAELLKSSMVRFNTRKHTNESILYTVDSITFTFGADIFFNKTVIRKNVFLCPAQICVGLFYRNRLKKEPRAAIMGTGTEDHSGEKIPAPYFDIRDL